MTTQTTPTLQAAQPASLPWLAKLVAIPTISGSSNLELIDLLEAEFGRYGYRGVRTYNEDGTRANLFITVPAADGTERGGLILSGHTDVVPVEDQAWDSDPFTLRVEGTRAYGRGVCDMKGFIAVALWLLPRVVEAKLRVPLHFAFSYDEEIGCVGAPSLIEEFVARNLAPDYAIVGEPSSMRIISAHKGAHRGRVTITGVPKHGSLATHGVNAVAAAGEFITLFTAMADEWEAEGPYDEAFIIPHSTGSVNLANGGLQYNIVAGRAVLEYDVRTLPQVSTESFVERIDRDIAEVVLPHLRERANRAEQLTGAEPGSLASRVGITHELLTAVPGLGTEDDAPLVCLAHEWLGNEDAPQKVTYGTEAGQFQRAGVQSIICGPGDIAQAHTPNEWIELDQLNECERFFTRILTWASAK